MGIIRRLDTQTINKIAAGEVVENPASVVKELVENAIDAGATEIYIEYLAGGLKLLRVSDNGCGMREDDAQLAFEQHATSKISTIEDLQEITTRGFRGEALASIASVSKVRLITSCHTQGVEVSIHGGVFQSVAPAARERGTTIEVRDLFYNVPARRKFQKSPPASATELIKTIIQLLLVNPGIRFQLISQGKNQLETKTNEIKTRIDEILGEQFMKGGFPVDFSEENFSIKGFIGNPNACRSNKAGQYLFVNGRPIQSYQISLAVKDGYGTRIDEKKHPIFVLFITIPGKKIDVNVHPQKREVRFTDETHVKDVVRRAIAKSFFHKTSEYMLPKVDFETPVFTCEEAAFEYTVKPKNTSFFQEEKQLTIIGKYQHYLLVSAPFLTFEEGLIFIHLKRARKRVFFEASKEEPLSLQKLITPEIIYEEMSEEEAKGLLFAGISARSFGKKETIIDAVAHNLTNVKEVFLSALDILRKGSSLKEKQGDILKLLALKNIQERWEQKTQAEAVALVHQLLKTKEPLICPEGKPICKGYTLRELEK